MADWRNREIPKASPTQICHHHPVEMEPTGLNCGSAYAWQPESAPTLLGFQLDWEVCSGLSSWPWRCHPVHYLITGQAQGMPVPTGWLATGRLSLATAFHPSTAIQHPPIWTGSPSETTLVYLDGPYSPTVEGMPLHTADSSGLPITHPSP
jgi:hypothetical protein